MAAVSFADGDGARWLSANPDKAWGEKSFLLYSPVWMLVFGIYQRTRVGDLGNLLVTLAIFAPVWVVPALLHPPTTRHWYEAYWFKLNLWIFVYAAIGTYFLSEYFYVLGMVYHYHTSTGRSTRRCSAPGSRPFRSSCTSTRTMSS